MNLKRRLNRFFKTSSAFPFLFLTPWLLFLLRNSLLCESRNFELTIEDTFIRLVKDQKFHTFAFIGQLLPPLIHVKYGDDVTVKVTNLTTHSMLQALSRAIAIIMFIKDADPKMSHGEQILVR